MHAVNNTLNIDPAYIAYMDTARMMNENGYVNGSYSWTEEWYADMGTDSNNQKDLLPVKAASPFALPRVSI